MLFLSSLCNLDCVYYRDYEVKIHNEFFLLCLQVQLFKLMQQLENSMPHFIRCIKPNPKQLPGTYDKNLVLEQLKCCEVLQVVRISKSGYPTRMTHQEFTRRWGSRSSLSITSWFFILPRNISTLPAWIFRYGVLLPESDVSQDPLSTSIAVLQQFDLHPEMYQVGYTKLYFRVGQVSLKYPRKIKYKNMIKVSLNLPLCLQQ